ncbi:hypothetical protein MTP04_31280 [Lysinibacillus sp. PLM2]|nr:hypothetical protein MTP04_31280 [Lysinibacillus sp. PLM2]
MERFNKILAVSSLTGVLLFSTTGVSAATFKDVNGDYWGTNEIDFLFEEKVVGGYQNGLFQPNKPITKGQMAIMLANALNLTTNEDTNIKFSDITKKHGSYQTFVSVIEAGIFSKESNFQPNKSMTKEEVAETLVQAFKLSASTDIKITDVPQNSAAYSDISAVIQNEIMTVNEDGIFNPKQKVTRGEFAVYLARALNKDFLPTQYNIPQNMNPVIILFNVILKNPDLIKTLFAQNNDFGFTALSKDIEYLDATNFEEIARLNGITEFVVHLNVELKGEESEGLISEGENTLYFLVTKEDYMEYKIVSVDKKPHLQADDSISFSQENAKKLFGDSNNAYWYVVMGGEGIGELKTFTKDGIEYRYMAQSLDSEDKLKSYLAKTYTPEQVAMIYKDLGFIVNNGKLAQPNADGGSLLDFAKATIKQTYNSTTVKKYELKIPLGDTNEVAVMEGELRFVEGQGWRVSSLKDIENASITNREALKLFSESRNAYWYVVRGGEGNDTVKTFTKDGMEYRYMNDSLNTEEKLRNYLGQYYTKDQVDQYYKDLGFITNNGKLAQPNADGGSLLDFKKGTIKLLTDARTVKEYELLIPLGDTKEVEIMEGKLIFVKGQGWRVSSLN